MAISNVNITIGFVNEYCFFPLELNGSLVTDFTAMINTSASMDQIYLPSGFPYFSDLGGMAAVEIINNSSTILPGVTVNIKRFTDCGPWWPTVENDYFGASGGWASSIMADDIINKHKDVIAVFGTEFSRTAIISAEALSYAQIPYCSGSSASQRLSNKHKYTYFWRILPSYGYGKHLLQLLNNWNVKRVAIVYEMDDSFALGGSSIPPPDGPPQPIMLYYEAQNFQGRAVLSFGVSGLIFGMVLIICLGATRTANKTIIEPVVLALGCMLGYVSTLISFLQPNLMNCNLKRILLLVGYSLVSCTVLSKTLVIVNLFGGVQVPGKERIRKLVMSSRILGAILVVIECVLVAVAKSLSTDPPLVVVGNYSFYSCGAASVGAPSAVEITIVVFNLGLFAVLCGCIYSLRVVPHGEYNECDQLVFVALGIASAFGLTMIMSGGGVPDFNFPMKQDACVWVVCTLTLVLMIFPRLSSSILVMRLEAKEGALSSGSKTVNDSKDEHNKANRKSEAARVAVAKKGSRSSSARKFEQNGRERVLRILIDKNPIAFRCRQQKLLLRWSEWFGVIGDIQSLHGRQWVTLRSSAAVWCYSIGPETRISHVGSVVCVRTFRDGINDECEMEFASDTLASQFASQFALVESGGQL
ncbi:Delta-1-pyrroline-5-carboxylate dehydrogenase, mitochondrial [Podochytrium sp. JEL0797]|nr:Delta-1-pyrroline-5-carboxylate dehydrogenase, mitochondrial [Podochytrium sp. JEL0797]